MNSTSSANSSVSTAAIIGGGGGSVNNVVLDDFHFPSDLISIQDRKDEAMLALKTDLMAALNKEVKSLDDDNWKFEGPRSHINLISRPELHHFTCQWYQLIHCGGSLVICHRHQFRGHLKHA
ncbi:protein SAMBA isoform X1 [Populus trichocarpa]|uniref:protein SAMBA isoform X1 n=1 Tax=Populus trichocarpa TaxID=3694 RepID=UPI0001936E16|nr:protein SAMBA isoform X1 [Populus trichocarpa]